LSLKLQKHGETLVVSVCGDFDLVVADCCRRDIDEKWKSTEVRDMVFDLERVTFIDSSGLGVILGRYRKVKENGGRVAIVGAAPRVNRILKLSGITLLIPVYPALTTALKDLA